MACANASRLRRVVIRRTLEPVDERIRWSSYVDATSDGVRNSEIARRAGVDPATVGRWRSGSTDPNPRQVVAYARAFGRPPVEALIAAGYLTAEEAEVPVAVAPADPLAAVSTGRLLREALRRVEADAAAGVGGDAEDDYEFTPQAPSPDDYRLAARTGTRK